MKKMSPLSEFSIYGLHNDKDIIIPFSYPCKILVSENGTGKTTLLNALYAVLTGRFFKLENLLFDKIKVKFLKGQLSIYKKDIEQFLEQEYKGEYKELKNKVEKDEFRKLISLAREYPLETLKELGEIQHIAKSLQVPPPLLAEKLKVFANDAKDKFSSLTEQIRKHFNFEVLYLTTYRRIEESLQDLGYSPTDFRLPSGLIQSGMDDVIKRVHNIKSIATQQQTSIENLLNEFTNICNSYLVDKKIIYQIEAENVTLNVYTHKNRLIPLEALSSGEKQIISIFSHLYLNSPKKCAILIDEPELSISFEWQRKLLPDILKSPKCQCLIAATHSPFIFDNELAAHTVDLREYTRIYD